MNRDYIVIGSIGYAQLGQDDYYQKEQVERKVLIDLVKENELFHVPEKLHGKCYLKHKAFQHECGTYKELCVIYHDDVDEEEEFWDWVNSMEEFDFESEEIMEKCAAVHREMYPMQVHYRGKKVEQNLKIVNE